LAKSKNLTLGGIPYYLSAFLGVALVLLAASFLVFTLILQGWDTHLQNQLGNERLKMFQQLVSAQFNAMQSATSGLAAAAAVRLEAGGNSVQTDMASMVAAPMSDLRRVVVFPAGRIARDDHPDLPVSFAALEMLKKVEAGEEVAPVAFKARDKRWYLLCAAPVRTAAGAIGGSLLAIFQPIRLQKALGYLPEGHYGLLQQVDGTRTPVFEAGTGDGMELSDSLEESGWLVTYTLPYPSLMDDRAGLYWGITLFAALLGGLVAAGAIVIFGRHAARDMASLAAFAGTLLSSGNSSPAKVRFALTRHAIEVLQQVRGRRSGTEKTAATEVTAAVAATSAPATRTASKDLASPGAENEPLFSADDALDIYDSEEDLLGLHEGSPVADRQVVSKSIETRIEVEESELVEVDPAMFRAYDIRGVAGRNLTHEAVVEIGRALGAEALERGQKTLCVGRDGRHSSPDLMQALVSGLTATGVNVIDLGVVPTPVLYFATVHLETGSGAVITGSHNPPEYNGIKMMLAGQTLADEQIQSLLSRIRSRNYPSGSGKVERRSVTQDYIDAIVGDIAVAAPLKVVLDAGSGAAGEVAPRLIAELGCEVIALNCEIDGDFPAHHPDPGKPENLQQLIAKVRETGADLGIAFDGDGDRLGVVTNTGKIIWPDRLLMLFAKDVVSRNPGADVLFDVKCSRRLNALISGYGGRPVMWRAGHSVMKAKMQETGALLAGELSGHIFFKERWYGFDDGIYSAARLLEILGVEDGSVDDVFAAFPEDVSTPELLVPVTDQGKFEFVQRLARLADWGGGTPALIDGIRVEYADGWGLCRASNTTPSLVLRFEAESQTALQRIQELFRKQMLTVDATLKLPF